MEGKRPSWDEYFIEICKAVRSRATCDRGYNGVVIAKNKQILTTGYVGSPAGLPHCDEVGHIIKEVKHETGEVTKHCLRTTHAEINAITQAAKLGVAIDEATLYTLLQPCLACAKAIVNSGIKRVVCEKRYHAGQEAEELLKRAGVQQDFVTNEMMVYAEQ